MTPLQSFCRFLSTVLALASFLPALALFAAPAFGQETSRPAPVRAPADGARSCRIASVHDGDTVRCESGERIRLLLIDAPELDQSDFGLRSRLALEEMLPVGAVSRVELDVRHRDRYGRLLAYLYAPDGRQVNRELVRRGYAVVSIYPPNVRYVDALRAAADSARAEGRGLWERDAFDCLPAEHRRGVCDL